MSIASEITRLQNAKASIKTSIEAKGVTVPSSAKLDTYSSYVDQIQTGGGTSKISDLIEGSITSMTASDFDGATSIRASGFEGCTNLTSVTMPNTITSMASGGYQFQNCTSLTSVTMSSNLEEISNYCFSGCSDLVNVNLANVKRLHYGAFKGCTSLATIDLSNIQVMDGNSNGGIFQGCTSLTNITMPTALQTINPQYLFNGCSSLTSFTMCTTLTGTTMAFTNTFEGCTSLQTLDLRNCGTKLAGLSMGGSSATLPNLTTVYFPPTVPGNFYNSSRRALQGTTSLVTVTLPEPFASTTTCGDAIFQHSGITTIITPNNLKTLGNYMFDNCSNLTNVTISADVNKLGNYCFSNCTLLTEITYLGTMANWNSMTKGTNWKQNTPLATVHCSDGDITL